MWLKSSTSTVALEMAKVFLDTNILVAATFWRGSSYELLAKIGGKTLDGFTTIELLDEYKAVLKRDFNHSEEESDERLKLLMGILTIVFPKEKIRAVEKDPDDNKVLEGALAARADFVISYDHHLLDLGSFRGIRIITPEELLKMP